MIMKDVPKDEILFQAYEKNFDFLDHPWKSLGEDMLFLTWPILTKRNGGLWPSSGIWILSITAFLMLTFIFIVFMVKWKVFEGVRDIFIQPHNQLSFVVTFSIVAFFVIGMIKLLGRLLYRFTIYTTWFFTYEAFFKEKKDKNKQADDKLVKTFLEESKKEARGFLEVLLIPKLSDPTATPKYDMIAYPVSSIIRFLVFDHRAGLFVIGVLATIFVVSSGFSFSTLTMNAENLEDDDNDDEMNQSRIMAYVFLVCVYAIVYITLHAAVLAVVREIGLKCINLLGSGQKPTLRNLVSNELICFNHGYSVLSSKRIWQIVTSVFNIVKKVALTSALTVLVSFVLVSLHFFLYSGETRRVEEDVPQTEDDNKTLKLTHFIESVKTLCIIVSLLMFIYVFFNEFQNVCSQD